MKWRTVILAATAGAAAAAAWVALKAPPLVVESGSAGVSPVSGKPARRVLISEPHPSSRAMPVRLVPVMTVAVDRVEHSRPRAQLPPADRGDIPKEYILGFYSDGDRAKFLALAKSMGATILGLLDLGHSVRVRVDDPEALRKILELAPTPTARSPNYYIRTSPPPPEKSIKANEGGYIGFGSAALAWLGVPADNAAWGRGITVAVLDTVVGTHPALAEQSVVRVSGPASSEGKSPEGWLHGTAVASLIVGTSEDIKGMAPGARVLAIPVLAPDGVGDAFGLAQGIVEAVDQGAVVINVCLGTPADCPVLKQAVDYALGKGAVIVAAAGNDATEGVLYPARYDGVVAVAAVDAAGRQLYFSNRGPEIGVAAPGIGVTAAGPDGKDISFSGTSAAVPFVSGALAAILSGDPSLSAQQAAGLLERYSDDAGAPGKDEEVGQGVIDIGRVANRDVRGIYDVAVGRPYVRADGSGGGATVDVYAQNQGTERLPVVRLTIDMDGVKEEATFYDVDVGQTVSRSLPLPRSKLAGNGQVHLSYTASLDGQEDARPANNAVAATIGVRAE
jgi:hypothetical protein